MGTTAASVYVVVPNIARVRAYSPYLTVGTAATTKTGTTFTTVALTAGGSRAWKQSDIDGLRMQLAPYGGEFSSEHDWRAVYLDVVTNEAPTPNVTLPVDGSTITTTSQPDTAATYTDPENNPLERYQIKVVTQATYSDPLFDINTSNSVWDTGPLIAAVTERQIGVPLANGTYRVYWRFADAGSSGRFGPWDFNTFTIALEPSGPPVIATAAVDAKALTTVEVTGRDNLLTANQASYETDTTGWQNNANVVRTRSVDQAAHGSASIGMPSIAAGEMSVTTPIGAAGVPVTPGLTYTAMIEFRAAATSRSCRIDFRWYRADGTSLSLSSGNAIPDLTTKWVRAHVTATAPAEAAFCALTIRVLATGAANELHYADKAALIPGSWNFVANGDVESSLTPWLNYVGTITRDDTKGADSRSSIRCTPNPAVSTASSGSYQDLAHPIAAGTTVTVSSWVWPPVGRTTVRIIMRDNTNGDSFFSATIPVRAGRWQRVTVTTTLPVDRNCERIYVVPCAVATGEPVLSSADVGWFDRCMIESGAAASPQFMHSAWAPGGFTESGRTAEVERSYDMGLTWEPVRRAKALPLVGSVQGVVIDDHEARRGVPVSYRARVTGTIGGMTLTSDWAPSVVTQLGVDGWWWKHPDHPEWNTQLEVAPGFRIAWREPQGTFDVLGPAGEETEPVHATDGVKGRALLVPTWVKDAEHWDAIERLVSSADVGLLQDNLGRQWWVKVQDGASADRIRAGDPSGTYQTRHFHSVQLDFLTAKVP